MTLDKALEIIKQFQDWRVDKRDDCNYSPKELTKAIDTVIWVMEQLPQTIENAFDDGYESGYDDAQGDGATHENGRDYYKSLTTPPTT